MPQFQYWLGQLQEKFHPMHRVYTLELAMWKVYCVATIMFLVDVLFEWTESILAWTVELYHASSS